MPKTKKITVVNIDDNDNKSDDVINTYNNVVVQPVDERIEILQEVIEKIETVETIPVVEDKITRTNDLIKCPKCHKMVTSKTLKYTHKNTCSGEEKNKLKKEVKQEEIVVKIPIPEPVHDIEEAPIPKPPKLVKHMNVIPESRTITPEMMREHRQQIVRERIQLRQDQMKNLFANSIK